MSFSHLPHLVMADGKGQVFEHPLLRMAGRTGLSVRPPRPGELMPLPSGSDLYILPGRRPVGLHPESGRIQTVTAFRRQPVTAVAAFLPPAHTSFLTAAFDREEDAPALPLYAYTALGWSPDGFAAAGVRVDPDPRQDLDHFPENNVDVRGAEATVREKPGNRLFRHLAHCCTVYRCPAARNLFLGRYEAPLPTSTVCNSRCVGCISYQENTGVPCSQDRIDFVPTPEEVAEVALWHIGRCDSAVVSFGQGCEGEPLTSWKVIEKAIRIIRDTTGEGTINLNTNARMPGALAALFDAGLDSIRVSLNSARPALYDAYFRPVNYTFEDVARSMEIAREKNRFVSMNYFVFPGIIDEVEELAAFERLARRTRPDMIQWRNLNIDPDIYIESLGWKGGSAMGVGTFMELIRERYPKLRFGYFNPALR